MNDTAEIKALQATPDLASMPMYTLPELEHTVAAWWRGVTRHFREAGIRNTPDLLLQPDNLMEHWTDNALVFSQTCGFPLMHRLSGKVRMIATPVYDAPGCDGPHYRSMVIVHESLDVSNIADLKQMDAAVNGWDSQSGFNVFRALIATVSKPDERFFARTLITGSHESSILAVRDGKAHCACVDGVTHALYQKYRPSLLEGTRILCETDSAPGLPFITAGTASDEQVQALRNGLFNALADPELVPLADRQLLKGATILELSEYEKIRQMAKQGMTVRF